MSKWWTWEMSQLGWCELDWITSAALQSIPKGKEIHKLAEKFTYEFGFRHMSCPELARGYLFLSPKGNYSLTPYRNKDRSLKASNGPHKRKMMLI